VSGCSDTSASAPIAVRLTPTLVAGSDIQAILTWVPPLAKTRQLCCPQIGGRRYNTRG
jgi:hypothetical protein